jgi:hypothetical protein
MLEPWIYVVNKQILLIIPYIDTKKLKFND